MIDTILEKVSIWIITGALVIANLFGYTPPISQQNLGADVIAGTTYTLSGSGISSSDTSIGLTSLTIPQTGREVADSDLEDTFYITLEPGSRTRQEIVSCSTVTQSGTDTTATLSGCIRGLLPFSPYTASSTYRFAHSGGTSVVFSNPPQLYNQFVSKLNDSFVTSTITFNSNTAPRYLTNPNFTGSSTTLIPDINYVNTVATSGSPNATISVKGLIELSTTSELIVGTLLGATGASLVVPNLFFNTTSSELNLVPVTMSDGKISSTFISTSSKYTWSGLNTFSSTTFSGNHSFSGTSTFSGSIISNGTSTFNGNVRGISTSTIATTTQIQIPQGFKRCATSTSGSINFSGTDMALITFSGTALINSNGGLGVQFYRDSSSTIIYSQGTLNTGASATIYIPLVAVHIDNPSSGNHTYGVCFNAPSGGSDDNFVNGTTTIIRLRG